MTKIHPTFYFINEERKKKSKKSIHFLKDSHLESNENKNNPKRFITKKTKKKSSIKTLFNKNEQTKHSKRQKQTNKIYIRLKRIVRLRKSRNMKKIKNKKRKRIR